MCSCPPFECTCARWNLQGSPKVANSPPFPAKKLNFYAPAFCEIPSSSGMQSLSIEIGTNKHLNHSNSYGLYPHDQSLPPALVSNASQISNFPIVPNQTSCYEARQSDFYPTSVTGFRDTNVNANFSRYSCDRLEPTGQAQLYLHPKRYRPALESCNILDKSCSEHDGFSSSAKRIKSENVVALPECTRSNTLAPNQTIHTRNDNGDGLFDESLDLLSSPFETDMYSSLVQRFNEGVDNTPQTQAMLTNQMSAAAMSTSFTELKSTQSMETRPRSCQQVLPGSTPRLVDNSFRNCNTEPIQSTTDAAYSGNPGYFPLHSQCMVPETPSCSYDYDQRLSHQQSQSPYCNHSINITLRYK